MKKNKMMRIASVLLVAVLISTCAISGTFAKYITKVEGTDSARVAKWGILLSVSGGDVFATEYKAHDETFKGTEENKVPNSVISSLEDKVVAPGTSSEDLENGSLKATVFGTPEVATRYTLVISDLKDVFLPGGEYTDYTEYVLNDEELEDGYTKTFETEAYSPVKWNLKVSNQNGVSYDLVTVAASLGQNFKGFSFTDAQSIVAAQNIMNRLLPMLEGMASGASNAQCVVNSDDGTVTISMDFDPNTEMDYTFELTWAWDFDDEGEGTYDKQDTLLGNYAAGEVVTGIDATGKPIVETLTIPDGVSTVLAATLTATAVQID